MGAQRELVSDVRVGGVSWESIVGLNIEAIDVPSIRVRLVENSGGSVRIKDEGS